MAEHTHTTGAGARLDLPPIIELGRSLAAMQSEYDRLDTAILAAPDEGFRERRAMACLFSQMEALKGLINTLPAATLADAAVQLALGAEIAGDMAESNHPRPRVKELAAQLKTITLSITPIIVAAAGMSLDAMGWGDIPTLRAKHFGLEDRA